MVDETDSVGYSAAAWLAYCMLFAAQSAAGQLFCVYLKYLGVSAGDAGALRALQAWAGVMASQAAAAVSRAPLFAARGRRAVAALLLLTSVAGYVSLVFVPPFVVPRDVTHCSHIATAAENWRLLSLDNPKVTTELTANKSLHHVVQDVKVKTSDTLPSEKKPTTDPKPLQSETTAHPLDTNELPENGYNWHKVSNTNNGEMESYDTPNHSSDDNNNKQTFNDKPLGRETTAESSVSKGRKGILNSYQKIINNPSIFNYELPFPGNSQENGPPYIPGGENGRDLLVTPKNTDYRYQSYHFKPVPSVNQHNYHYQSQWRDQNKIDEQQRVGTSEERVEGDRRMFVNPEWKTFQKQPNNINSELSGQRPYQYEQPLHNHRHREQQLSEVNNYPYHSDNQYREHNIQQDYEQEEENLDLSKSYHQVEPFYEDLNRIRVVKHRVRTRTSNSDVLKTVDGVNPFHLDLATSNHMLLGEITARKRAIYNRTDLAKVLQKDVVANSHLNSTSEIPNSSHSVANSMYTDSITYFSTLEGFGASKYGLWSTVFYTVFAISVFLETSCQSTLVWILRICGTMTQNTSEVLHEFATSSRVLVGWSVVACPLVGVVAALSPCPYQITAHMAAAAALTFCVLLLLPLVSPVPRSRKRKPSKPSYRKTYEDDTIIKRFSSSLRMGITGFITACNLEFMMWYMEAQEIFSHNYEILYCGYSATASLTQFLLTRLLRQKSGTAEEAESESEDETGGGRWRPHRMEAAAHRRWWWLWEAGTLLLAAEQLAAEARPVWLLPPLLGVLQGAGSALSSRGAVGGTSGTSYRTGYGCGCLAAGLFVQAWGAPALFRALGLGTSICAALAAVITGVARCTANKGQQVRAHSFSIASAESDASSDGEENEIAETDDWLVQALQRDEYRQAKKCHRTEC